MVPSAISSGDSTDYQTFDIAVHTNSIRLVPKFQHVTQWININEVMNPRPVEPESAILLGFALNQLMQVHRRCSRGGERGEATQEILRGGRDDSLGAEPHYFVGTLGPCDTKTSRKNRHKTEKMLYFVLPNSLTISEWTSLKGGEISAI